MVKGVIFDMDGVLVNSEPVITKAAIAALREFGVNAQQSDFHPFTGMGEDRFIGGVAEKYGKTYVLEMKKRTYEFYLSFVKEEIGVYPGIPELMQSLQALGLQTAVASSADGIKVLANLDAAGIDTALFSAICSGEDVVHKKPAPDIFLLAAERMKLRPEDCVVVEDALSGIQAALTAKMDCIAIRSSFPEDALLGAGATVVFEQTKDILAFFNKY